MLSSICAGTDAEQIEDGEVDVEALVALPGEHADVAGQLLDAAGECAVVRRGARADVRRRHRQAARQLGHSAGAARAVDARQAIELADVQVRIVERGHRAGVVEERRRVADFGREPPLERDVFDRIPVVVDVDLVDDVRIERVEVRSAVRLLERDEVRDERDLVGLIGDTNAYTSVLSAIGSWR